MDSMLKPHIVWLAFNGCAAGQTFNVDIVRHFEGTALPNYVKIMTSAASTEDVSQLDGMGDVNTVINHHGKEDVESEVGFFNNALESGVEIAKDVGLGWLGSFAGDAWNAAMSFLL